MPTISLLDGKGLLNTAEIRTINVTSYDGFHVGYAYCGTEEHGYPVIRKPTYEEAKRQAEELAELIFGPVVWPPAKTEARNGVLQNG